MIYCLGILLKGSTNKMTIKKFIKQWLLHACVYFTLLMVVYTAIAAIVNVNDDTLLLDAGRCALFFVFALLLAVANTFFSFENMHVALKVIIHYAVTVAGFYACFLLPLSMQASGVLVGLALFSVIYFVILGLWALFKSRYQRNKENAEAYQSKYKGKGK